MRFHVTAIVGFAFAALASPTPSKTIQWVVQTSQCANLPTAAYGPRGPEILQQMNTPVVTDKNSIDAGATLALPPPAFSDKASVSTHVDASGTQEYLVITGTCSDPSTAVKTPTSSPETGTPVATTTGETIADTVATEITTATATGTTTTQATTTQETSTSPAPTGWLLNECSKCYLVQDVNEEAGERSWFRCICGEDFPPIDGYLKNFVIWYSRGALGLSPMPQAVADDSIESYTDACNSIDIEEPFKFKATCKEEKLEYTLAGMDNTSSYAIMVGRNSVGDRYFFLDKVG